MAEEVIIKFDLGTATNNIARLEAELKKVKQEYKSAEIGSKEFYKAQDAGKQLTEQIKKQNDALKANTNALNGINSAAKFGKESYGALKQNIKSTKDELLKLDVGSDAFIKTQKELTALELKRIDIEKQIPSLFQERIKMAVDETNSLKGLKDQIKQYTAAVIAGEEGAAQKLAELKDKLDDVKDATNSFKGSGVEKLNASMGLLTESLSNFDGDKFKTALTGIGTAMKAIPIFLILEGIKLLIENFGKIYDFAQSFTDVAQESKKAALTYEKQKASLDKLIYSMEGSISIQEAKIDLMKTEGKSNADILVQEKLLFDSKVNLIKTKATELKLSGQANIAKLKEIMLNDSLTEATYRLYKNISTSKEADRALDVLIANEKKERSKEVTEKLAADEKALAELSTELQLLTINKEKKTFEDKKEINEKAIAASRSLRQAEIDNIKDVYDQQAAQIEFDRKNKVEDLKREKNYQGSKSKLISEFNKKAATEQEAAKREELKRLQDLDNTITQYKIDLIRSDYQRESEQIKLNEKKALEEAEATIINNPAYLNQVKQEIAKKYAEENRRLALDYVTKDMEAEAELNVLKAKTYDEQFQARQQQLELQKQTELSNLNLTEQERLRILEEYKKKEIELEQDKARQKQAFRDAEIQLTASAFQSLNNLAILFSDDQKQIEKLAKIGALINIAANTGMAISGLIATSFSPTQKENLVNPLAPYLKIAAGVATITSNALQAKAIVNSFEEGGYTGDGSTNEVSTNLGTKPYTYHKSEYVIPARVLATPMGGMLASQAESMRLGMSNPMPYIGGMFDGGFTARSAGADANSSINNNAMIKQMLSQLPTPIVKVTDINKVQQDVVRVQETSSL